MPRSRLLPPLVLLLTVGQLAVVTFVPGTDRFAGKAFDARLIAYPPLMLVVPLVWWLVVGRRDRAAPVPHGAFALVMTPFLVDVMGNTLNLHDAGSWWDDANHLVNRLLLYTGLGLLIAGDLPRRWQAVALVTGLGAALAIAWELAEWWTFIRHGGAARRRPGRTGARRRHGRGRLSDRGSCGSPQPVGLTLAR